MGTNPAYRLDANIRNYVIIVLLVAMVMSSFELIPYLLMRHVLPQLPGTLIFIIIWMLSFLSIMAAFGINYWILKPFVRQSAVTGKMAFLSFIIAVVSVALIGFFTFHLFCVLNLPGAFVAGRMDRRIFC